MNEHECPCALQKCETKYKGYQRVIQQSTHQMTYMFFFRGIWEIGCFFPKTLRERERVTGDPDTVAKAFDSKW